MVASVRLAAADSFELPKKDTLRTMRGVDLSSDARGRLIVALDVPTPEAATEVVDTLGDEVSFYKVGLQLQYAGSQNFVRDLVQKRNKRVFLDTKFHDIEQTVTGAVASVARLGVEFLTIHGNAKSVKAAIEGRRLAQSEFDCGHNLKILLVTYLTNLDSHDLKDFELKSPDVKSHVLDRAKMALHAGADGVIASGQEVQAIKEMVASEQGALLVVTPGIRRQTDSLDDQRRASGPKEAILGGSDYIVVGRPILRASDPRSEAKRFLEQIAAGLQDRKTAGL